MKKIKRLFAILLLSVACGCEAQDVREKLTQKEKLEIFDQVWARVNDTYFDPDFGGKDWAAIKKQYAPRIEDSRSEDEFFTHLNQL